MRVERFIQTWGTVIVVDAAAENLDEGALNIAVDKVERFFLEVNENFSTYIPTSQVSTLRACLMEIDEASADVLEVWNLCGYARQLTLGAFDPWAVEGGFDPSGIVKGWASEKAAEMLLSDGVTQVLINAAGDLVLRGGAPWQISVTAPEDAQKSLKTFDVVDGAVATSGDYERGAHIRDPHTGLIAIGARSATVIGPNGAIADALATALMVDGRDAQKWMGREELSEYSYWVLNRDDETAWSYGPVTGR
ncbi:Flavin transferase ApbE [Candidatus Nanopelagicaceae bacterium]